MIESKPESSCCPTGTEQINLDSLVQRVLHVMKSRLHMDAAYISEFVAEPGVAAVAVSSISADGTHVSVPIKLPDGTTYGMFCCSGAGAAHSLLPRDQQMMEAFAELMAFEINHDIAHATVSATKKQRITNAIEDQQVSLVYQPIWNIASGRAMGVECLARFSGQPARTPDKWFNEAAEVGLGIALELVPIHMALATIGSFPPDVSIAVNVSPATILSPEFTTLFENAPVAQLMLEVTEHAHIDDYGVLLNVLAPLRKRGMQLAVDDAGAGYASLQHILNLHPELIKLDMAMTREIDKDPTRRALAAALVQFAGETGSRVIAEGVETASELAALNELGIVLAQGYLLGRPASLAQALGLFDERALAAAAQ